MDRRNAVQNTADAGVRTMKCIRCILEYLVDIPLTSESMLYAVDGAQTAVTITRGTAFCGQHLLAHLFDVVLESSPIKLPAHCVGKYDLGQPEK